MAVPQNVSDLSDHISRQAALYRIVVSSVPHEVAGSSQIRVLVGLDTLQILFLDKLIDRLLDIRNFRREARFDLVDSFLHELDVLQLFAGLHDADDGRL